MLRRRGNFILIAMVAALASPGAAAATTIQVETTADVVADNGTCSLREAVNSANTNTQVDDCEQGQADPATDTILMQAGIYPLSAGELVLNPSNPNGDITLEGVGAQAVTIDAGATSRVLSVIQSTHTVTITGVTLTDGNVTGNGGGISSSSSLELISTRVLDNDATQSGGGIALFSGASLTTGGATQIDNNTALLQGGGVNLATGGGDIVIGAGTTVDGNTTNGLGGGLATNSGNTNTDILVTDASVSDNHAREGGGIYFFGGGPTGGDLTLDGATVSGNLLDKPHSAGAIGGGMNVLNGDTLSITDSDVSNNSIQIPSDAGPNDNFTGAGVAATMQNVDILRSEIAGNSITAPDNGDNAFGAGFSSPSASGIGEITVSASTFADNTLGSGFGSPTGSFQGGGVYIRDPAPATPIIDVRNSTFSGNSAGEFANSSGGAFAVFAGATAANLQIFFSTIAGNVAGPSPQPSAIDFAGGGGGVYHLEKTIVDNGPDACDSAPHTTNLTADAGTSCVAAGNFSGVDADLGPLAENGGLTRTRMLLGPPALIDAAPTPCNDLTGNTITTDQRGFARPSGPGCDLGAVERTPPGAPALTGFDPASPANDNSPNVLGTAPAGTTVTVYGTANCTGPPLGFAPAADFSTTGAAVGVPDNTTTTFSATASNAEGTSVCSNAISFTEQSPPPAPNLTGFNPSSPANDNSPELRGNAAAGTTVTVYANGACTGTPMGTTSAAQLANPGLTVTVPDNSATTFSATATLPGGTSPCSNAVTYTEQTPATPATPKRCAGVIATRTGTDGRDTLVGTAGADVIVGLGGNDTIRSLGGNDIVCGGGGNDGVFGGAGDDVLRGEGGRDVLQGAGGKDKLLGGNGRDSLKGGGGSDLLNAAAGRRELCHGGPARDRFRGCERTRGRP